MKTTTTEERVLAVLEDVREGLLKRDAQAVARAYRLDAAIFDLAPPLAHAINTKQLQDWIDGWDGPVRQSLRDFKLTISEGLAVGHGFIQVSARTRSGEDAAWWMRATVCLTQQHGEWKIIHEHTSVPFYMDGSFRAAIDLVPE